MNLHARRILLALVASLSWSWGSATTRADEGAAAAPVGATASPTGYWKTFCDENGKLEPRSIVQLSIDDGKLSGKIEKLFLRPDEDPTQKCEKCTGELQGKPVIGLRFLWGLSRSDARWEGGAILDPANGRTYGCTIKVIDGGKRLKVRGYIGIPLVGRTQYWERVDVQGDPAAAAR